jgi:DNA-binding XRE family transcriptional regulator
LHSPVYYTIVGGHCMKIHDNTGKLVAQLRKVIQKSQSQFAAMIGVSKHTIISVENGRNKLSKNLARRIRIATGAKILEDKFEFEPLFNLPTDETAGELSPSIVQFLNDRCDGVRKSGDAYTLDDFQQWRKNFYPSNEDAARKSFAKIKVWVEYVFRAAAKSGATGNRDRLPAVYQSLVEWLEETVDNFKLFGQVDDILEEEARGLGECAFNALSFTKPENPKELENLKKQIAEYGYDFNELKKYCKKAKVGDWIVLQTELRKLWDPFDGRESTPCANWKILKEQKYWLEFGYDYFARKSKISIENLLGNQPELIAAVEKLRRERETR